MDRRTALAFGLMAVVIIGFSILQNTLFPPEPVPETPEDLSTDTEMVQEVSGQPETPDSGPRNEFLTPDPVEGAPTDGSSAPLNVAEALAVDTHGSLRQFEVTTPLYRAVISNRGGRIVSFEALEHESHLGGPVQLIPSDIPANGLDALVFRMGEMPLGVAMYAVEGGMDHLVVDGSGPRTLTLTTRTQGGLEVRKTYTFTPDTYGIHLNYVLAEVPGSPAREALNLLGSPEDFRFTWNQGIAPTERTQKMEEPAMRSLAHVGDELHVKKRNGLAKSEEKVTGQFRGTVHYAAVQNKYFTVFGIASDPDDAPIEGAISLGGDQATNTLSWAMDIPALRGMGGEIATAGIDLFIGPASVELVQDFGHDVTAGVDLGIRWIRPLSSLVLWFMNWMNQFIPNYGIIIIIFSVLTKLLFYPLTQKQTESMKKMQEIQPKLKALQEKYKKDKEKLNQATMQMYKEEGVNPLAGCLPLVVQMPVFFALYQGLSHTISLRMQPFFGWINDLSQPDALFQLPFDLPFLGSDFNVLPILMALAMYVQGKVAPTTAGGGQMAAMTTMMPLFMVFIFYNMPSGLVLYWLVNTILQVYQSWKIHRNATHDGGRQTT
jgi:YidC/Oxa1 family membrane protein insertase